MIKLSKIAKPDVLTENGEAWTQKLLAKIASNLEPTPTEKTRYRHPDIKAALVAETHGKCAYCESKLQHIHHGDVEHIFPKSRAPEKTFEWCNLTFSCEICNQNKSDKDPHLEHIIDPYHIDPALHLQFLGSLVFSLGSPLGKNTEVILDLNRVGLCEARKEHLVRVMGIFETIFREELPLVTRKSIYENLLAQEGSSSAAYSAMTVSALTTLRKKLPQEFFD
jgi:hypothetical protein